MVQKCLKCSNDCCPGEILVACEGFCEGIRQFHARCVGLTEDEAGVCLYRNIMWMCDDCRDLMENIHFRSTVVAAKSINEPVSSQTETIEVEVAHLCKIVNQLNTTIGSLIDNISTSTPESLPLTTDIPPLSSTIIQNTLSAETAAEEIRNLDGPNETFKLYLSNIANDVTGAEVNQMISNAIGVDRIYSIKCLKPTWKDVSTMDFISFKVEIDGKYRADALKSSNWPKGLRYREFKDYTETTWRPER